MGFKRKHKRNIEHDYGNDILNKAYEKFFKGEHLTYEEFVIMLSTNDELYFDYHGDEYQIGHHGPGRVSMCVTSFKDEEPVLVRCEEFSSLIELLTGFLIDGKKLHEIWDDVRFCKCR